MTNPDAGRTQADALHELYRQTKRERDQAREALRKADAAAFKLTAALCALTEYDDERISRPSTMRLVVQWRTERDAALSGRKEKA